MQKQTLLSLSRGTPSSSSPETDNIPTDNTSEKILEEKTKKNQPQVIPESDKTSSCSKEEVSYFIQMILLIHTDHLAFIAFFFVYFGWLADCEFLYYLYSREILFFFSSWLV